MQERRTDLFPFGLDKRIERNKIKILLRLRQIYVIIYLVRSFSRFHTEFSLVSGGFPKQQIKSYDQSLYGLFKTYRTRYFHDTCSVIPIRSLKDNMRQNRLHDSGIQITHAVSLLYPSLKHKSTQAVCNYRLAAQKPAALSAVSLPHIIQITGCLYLMSAHKYTNIRFRKYVRLYLKR